MSRRGVVVSGRGIICSAGSSISECTEKFLSGTPCLSPVSDHRLTANFGAHFAGLIHTIPKIDWHSSLTPYIDRHVALAMTAAREACVSSGKLFADNSDRTGIIIGTCSGPMITIESMYEAEMNGEVSVDTALMFSRQYYSASLILAEQFGIQGPAFTVTTACSAFTVAAGIASDLIRIGILDAVLVGGCDAFSATTQAGFNGLKATCKEEICAPFSRPFGLNLGEGAAFLLLEDTDSAHRRNATIYGEILGYGLSNDAWHCSAPDPSGRGAAYAIQRALNDAELTKDTIRYINAHGTGTEANDKSETKAIRIVFGDTSDTIPVSSLKAVTGHCLGAAGAIETVASLECIRNGLLPPTANFSQAREGCTLDYTPDCGRQWKTGEIFIKNNFAFGGNNASLLMCDVEKKFDKQNNREYPDDPICITAMGIVSAAGIGLEVLLGKDSNPCVNSYKTSGYSVNVASVPEFKMSSIDKRIDTKGVDQEAQLAIAAAALALSGACISERLKLRRDLGLMMNLAQGSTWAEPEHIQPLLKNNFKLEQISAFPYIVPNSISGTICRALSLTGFNSTFCNGLYAGLSGLALTWVAMMNGHAPIFLCGTVDKISKGMLDCLCTESIDPGAVLLGEGSAMFVLERRSHAQSRGVKHLCSIESVAFSNTLYDNSCGTKSDCTLLRNTITRAIESAKISYNDIGCVTGNLSEDQKKAVENLIGKSDFIDISSVTGFAPCSQPLFNLAASITKDLFGKNGSKRYILTVSSPYRGNNCVLIIKNNS